MSELKKAVRPLAGIVLALTLFQGLAGWELVQGSDYGHKHTAYLLTALAIALGVVVFKSEIDYKSVKDNSFAVAVIAVIQLLIGLFLMAEDWSYGWIHVPLAMMLAAHSFAVLISMRQIQ